SALTLLPSTTLFRSDEQHRPIDAGDACLGAGRQVRAADRPFAIAETNAPSAILQPALEHDHLTDMAMPKTVARQWTIELALLLTMQPPEIEPEYRASEDHEPRHRCKNGSA